MNNISSSLAKLFNSNSSSSRDSKRKSKTEKLFETEIKQEESLSKSAPDMGNEKPLPSLTTVKKSNSAGPGPLQKIFNNLFKRKNSSVLTKDDSNLHQLRKEESVVIKIEGSSNPNASFLLNNTSSDESKESPQIFINKGISDGPFPKVESFVKSDDSFVKSEGSNKNNKSFLRVESIRKVDSFGRSEGGSFIKSPGSSFSKSEGGSFNKNERMEKDILRNKSGGKFFNFGSLSKKTSIPQKPLEQTHLSTITSSDDSLEELRLKEIGEQISVSNLNPYQMSDLTSSSENKIMLKCLEKPLSFSEDEKKDHSKSLKRMINENELFTLNDYYRCIIDHLITEIINLNTENKNRKYVTKLFDNALEDFQMLYDKKDDKTTEFNIQLDEIIVGTLKRKSYIELQKIKKTYDHTLAIFFQTENKNIMDGERLYFILKHQIDSLSNKKKEWITHLGCFTGRIFDISDKNPLSIEEQNLVLKNYLEFAKERSIFDSFDFLYITRKLWLKEREEQKLINNFLHSLLSIGFKSRNSIYSEVFKLIESTSSVVYEEVDALYQNVKKCNLHLSQQNILENQVLKIQSVHNKVKSHARSILNLHVKKDTIMLLNATSEDLNELDNYLNQKYLSNSIESQKSTVKNILNEIYNQILFQCEGRFDGERFDNSKHIVSLIEALSVEKSQ